MPTSPIYSDNGFEYPTSPVRRSPGSRIDYSKFKTKLCRHFVQGSRCPFEDRCAFSHGDGVTEEAPREMIARPRTYLLAREAERKALDERDLLEGSMETASSSDSYTAPPPPSYDVAVQEDLFVGSDAYTMPPAYSVRYRYDPYSPTCVMYE